MIISGGVSANYYRYKYIEIYALEDIPANSGYKVVFHQSPGDSDPKEKELSYAFNKGEYYILAMLNHYTDDFFNISTTGGFTLTNGYKDFNIAGVKKGKVEFENFLQLLKDKKRTFVGYPVNTTFDYSEISDFLEYPINNVGDPFDSSYYGINSKKFEVKVLDWFAKLYKAPPDNYWGYVTNGGTEGNMYGLYLARELYPKGVVYYSQDTHYSVSKNIRMLGMEHVMIKSRRNGEMDYDDLRHMIATWRSAPPIIFANMGTTMKEGVDDITEIKKQEK